MLLIIKAISMAKAGSGIFSIQTRDFKAFQFENPQARPSRITVELFSNDGGMEVIFMQKAGAAAISQAEINRVIQSIHKTPIQTAAKAVSGFPFECDKNGALISRNSYARPYKRRRPAEMCRGPRRGRV
jgi:hypothetical protein